MSKIKFLSRLDDLDGIVDVPATQKEADGKWDEQTYFPDEATHASSRPTMTLLQTRIAEASAIKRAKRLRGYRAARVPTYGGVLYTLISPIFVILHYADHVPPVWAGWIIIWGVVNAVIGFCITYWGAMRGGTLSWTD